MTHSSRSLIATAFAGALLAIPVAGAAQQPLRELIAGARAQLVDELNPDSARVLLLRVLDPASALGPEERVAALVLLGVTELTAGQIAAAQRAFREALRLQPRLRIDSLAAMHSSLLSVFAAEQEALADARRAQPAVLELRGLPDGARLQVDGVAWVAARRREVAPGWHRFDVRASGYVPLQDSVLVDTGATLVRDVALERALESRLSVNSVPWAVVWLDSERIGETPLFNQPVPSGGYRLRLESPLLREPTERQILLRANRPTQLGTYGSPTPSGSALAAAAVADSLFWAMDFDSALALFRSLATDAGPRMDTLLMAYAATRVGIIHFTMSKAQVDAAYTDLASRSFRTAYQLAPSFALPPEELGSELRAAIDSARSSVLLMAVGIPRDTVVSPLRGRLRLTVRLTRVARVGLTLTDAAGAVAVRTDWIQRTADPTWVDVSRGGVPLGPGQYTLRVSANDSSGEAARLFERRVEVSRVPVDTAPIPRPPAPSAFLPETTLRGPGAPAALVLGAWVGAATVVLPALFSAPAVNPSRKPEIEAYVVGGTATLAGLISFAAGKRMRFSAANAERNRVTREAFQRALAAATRANSEARQNAGVRIRVVERLP